MVMREIDVAAVAEAVRDLCVSAAFRLPVQVGEDLARALEMEESPGGRHILKQLLENAALAAESMIPLCQDTGLTHVLLKLGRKVALIGGDPLEAVNRGMKEAYRDGYLRKSTVHPLTRVNRGDNSPAQIEVQLEPGQDLTIVCAPKGGGCDNMSRLFMLKPSEGRDGMVEQVVRAVDEAASNPCPPIYLGVAVGGSFDTAPGLAKKALWANIKPDEKPLTGEETALGEEILARVNSLGHGPAGLGGRITALGVRVHLHPCHMASLPVAVNISCHSLRLAWASL